jgi:hypothetical protein
MSRLSIVFFIFVTSLFANTDVKSLDMFLNKTFVNQKITSKNSADLLGQVRLEDIRFILPKECEVQNKEVNVLSFEDDSFSKEVEALEDKINIKESEIKALKGNITFLQKGSISSTTKGIVEASKFLKDEIFKNYSKIYMIEKSLKKEKDALSELLKKRVNSKFTRLNYNLRCSKDAFLSYPIYNLSKNSVFDINYDSKAKKIEIKNLLYLNQSTGFDLKDIDVKVYTYNFFDQTKPIKFYPEYLDVEKNIRKYKSTLVENEAMPILLKAKDDRIQTFEYLENETKSFFKASHVNLLSGKKAEIILAKDIYKAKNTIEIDGYSAAQAFYTVSFKSKKLYGMSNAKLYLDGTYIGQNYSNKIEKDKETFVYFGTNKFIDVKKELDKDMKEEPLFSLNKLKNQKIWKYEIKNKQNKVEKVVLVERLPVSKHEDIKVELIKGKNYSKLDKNGKIVYNFDLKPNETKIIEFGYEIEKPNSK